MRIIYLLLPILFLVSCNDTTGKKSRLETKLNERNAAINTSTTEASASIKISKNGNQVAQYSPSGPAATILKISGNESMMIKLNSADNVYSILGTLKTPTTGNYKLGEERMMPKFNFYLTGALNFLL